MRQPGLVDDAEGVFAFAPDGTVMLALNLHAINVIGVPWPSSKDTRKSAHTRLPIWDGNPSNQGPAGGNRCNPARSPPRFRRCWDLWRNSPAPAHQGPRQQWRGCGRYG